VTDNADIFDDEDTALVAIEGMSVLEMIGELLAAAAQYFDRRLGGPGVYRRLLSILATFVTVMVMIDVRQRAAILQHRLVPASKALRHLCCPPSRWAGA
jgi:hypothetical protein